MLKTNEKKLVRIVVDGKVAPALVYPNSVGHDGRVHNLPSLGGITLNVLIGDSAFGWAADHVEPAVSTLLNSEKRGDRPNTGYNFLACIGNEARVTSGAAKGARGVVTGRHGGCEHVIVDLPVAAMEKLCTEDRIQIRTCGQGLSLTDHPEVSVCSVDPALLRRMGIKERGERIEVPVAAVVPGKLMGSGIGQMQSKTGDYDLQTSDKKALARHGIDELKLGDIVAISDHDASFGWRYLEGACLIGVVAHGDSNLSGHGPGITTILTCPTGKLIPKKSSNANIGRLLKIGRFRKK